MAVEVMAPALGGLHHISLTVRDVARSEEWYRKTLGLERVMVEEHPGGHAVVLNRPGTPLFVGVHHHDAGDGATFSEVRTGLDHVAIAVTSREDLDLWAEHFDQLGVPHGEITDVEEPFPYSVLVFRDPDNIQLELISM